MSVPSRLLAPAVRAAYGLSENAPVELVYNPNGWAIAGVGRRDGGHQGWLGTPGGWFWVKPNGQQVRLGWNTRDCLTQLKKLERARHAPP